MRNTLAIAMAIAVLAAAGSTTAGGMNLVQNGGFETLSAGVANSAFPSISNAYLAAPLELTNWTFAPPMTGYLFGPGGADTTGALNFTVGVNAYYVGLWGPNNGANNGLPATSPNGGNYFAEDDPVGYNSALYQTIGGLTAGKQYKVDFYWAAAQIWVPGQGIYNGATENQVAVSLGGQTFTTPLASIPSHGFSGWTKQDFVFTASSPSEVLSFLFESPNVSGLPPAALLDGVSMTAVPEPASWVMMLMGLAGLGGLARRRRAMGRDAGLMAVSAPVPTPR